ncbi:ATP-binding protein [Lysinibacillus sp. BF-4]|uniref:ATP-binding protein n=1 Tax=Lysinibacillus sp. BF-4 TaxID=1473546 RepID=UPI001F339251|nr:ATP-binding protein [Lysinibacillus sp. BF-4]
MSHNQSTDLMNQLVDNITKNGATTLSNPDGVVCVHCGTLVPPLEVEVLGRKRTVQPVCKCVTKLQAAEQKRFENYQREKDVRRLFAISDVGNRYQNVTFTNFTVRPGTENSLKLAKHYVSRFNKENPNALLFFGEPGNGKTHLAAAVHNALVAQGHVIVFISMTDLLNKIKSTFNKAAKETQDDILKALAVCDLLIIDDIGAEKISDWVEETVYRILDTRYRCNRPVVATSNLTTDEICAKLGSRIHDRLLEMCQPVYNAATSYRKELAQKRTQHLSKLIQTGEI